MTRQEIIDEVAFTLGDEVAEYFDAYHDGKLEFRLLTDSPAEPRTGASS